MYRQSLHAQMVYKQHTRLNERGKSPRQTACTSSLGVNAGAGCGEGGRSHMYSGQAGADLVCKVKVHHRALLLIRSFPALTRSPKSPKSNLVTVTATHPNSSRNWHMRAASVS